MWGEYERGCGINAFMFIPVYSKGLLLIMRAAEHERISIIKFASR